MTRWPKSDTSVMEDSLLEYWETRLAAVEARLLAVEEKLKAVDPRQGQLEVFTCGYCNHGIGGEPLAFDGLFYHKHCYSIARVTRQRRPVHEEETPDAHSEASDDCHRKVYEGDYTDGYSRAD